MLAPKYTFDPETLREVAEDQDLARAYADDLLASYRARALSPELQRKMGPELIQWLRISGQYSRAEEVARTGLTKAGGADLLEQLADPNAPVVVRADMTLVAARLATALLWNAESDPTKISQAADLLDACEFSLNSAIYADKAADEDNITRLGFVLQHRAKLRLEMDDRILALRDANLALTLRTNQHAPNDLIASSQFSVDAILNLIERDIEEQVNAAGASIATETFAAGDRSGFGAVSGTNRIGPWLFWHKGGRLKSAGHYVNDQLTGPWVWFREQGGLLQEGSFVDNLQEGLWIRYRANGHYLDRGEFSAGQKTGAWQYFNEDGSLRSSQTYKLKLKARLRKFF
ncbi:hypothetical protein [Timonella senegalensis]|uniref:toxin-antitoxin system YwqK family antitoxin n=3 Tax=Timonella senegalensis TaxID=1465825 RepID=UPI002FDEE730